MNPLQSFVLPANGRATPESIARKRKIAEAMMAQGMQTGPIGHWSQGAARMVNALMGGIAANRADRQESEGRKGANDALIKALSGDANVAPSQQDPNGALLGAINDPWQSPQGSAMAMDMWQKQNTPPDPAAELDLKIKQLQFEQMQQPDPMKAMEIEKMQLEIQKMRNPQPDAPTVTEFYDEKTGQKYKAQWNGSEWVRVGGAAAGDNGITIGPDGTVQIGGSGKPLTEGQSKDAVYVTRAEGALREFEPKSTALTSPWSSMGSKLPVVGNYAKSPEYQAAEQSGREFLAAILRKDTGAAITKEEMAEYGTTFLPQPGDTPETLAQKTVSRRRAVEAIKAGMPPQAIIMQENALRKSGAPAPQQGQSQDATMPPGVDPALWNVMTPEERALWQN